MKIKALIVGNLADIIGTNVVSMLAFAAMKAIGK